MRNELFPLGLEKVESCESVLRPDPLRAGTPNWARLRLRLLKETAKFPAARGHRGVYRYPVYHE